MKTAILHSVLSLMIVENRRNAVVGIQTVEEGKEIFGAMVVRISQSCVELEMDGKRWTQEVEGEKK